MNTSQVPEKIMCRPPSDSEETEYVQPTDLLTATENWTPEKKLAVAVSTLLVAWLAIEARDHDLLTDSTNSNDNAP